MLHIVFSKCPTTEAKKTFIIFFSICLIPHSSMALPPAVPPATPTPTSPPPGYPLLSSMQRFAAQQTPLPRGGGGALPFPPPTARGGRGASSAAWMTTEGNDYRGRGRGRPPRGRGTTATTDRYGFVYGSSAPPVAAAPTAATQRLFQGDFGDVATVSRYLSLMGAQLSTVYPSVSQVCAAEGISLRPQQPGPADAPGPVADRVTRVLRSAAWLEEQFLRRYDGASGRQPHQLLASYGHVRSSMVEPTLQVGPHFALSAPPLEGRAREENAASMLPGAPRRSHVAKKVRLALVLYEAKLAAAVMLRALLLCGSSAGEDLINNVTGASLVAKTPSAVDEPCRQEDRSGAVAQAMDWGVAIGRLIHDLTLQYEVPQWSSSAETSPPRPPSLTNPTTQNEVLATRDEASQRCLRRAEQQADVNIDVLRRAVETCVARLRHRGAMPGGVEELLHQLRVSDAGQCCSPSADALRHFACTVEATLMKSRVTTIPTVPVGSSLLPTTTEGDGEALQALVGAAERCRLSVLEHCQQGQVKSIPVPFIPRSGVVEGMPPAGSGGGGRSRVPGGGRRDQIGDGSDNSDDDRDDDDDHLDREEALDDPRDHDIVDGAESTLGEASCVLPSWVPTVTLATAAGSSSRARVRSAKSSKFDSALALPPILVRRPVHSKDHHYYSHEDPATRTLTPFPIPIWEMRPADLMRQPMTPPEKSACCWKNVVPATLYHTGSLEIEPGSLTSALPVFGREPLLDKKLGCLNVPILGDPFIDACARDALLHAITIGPETSTSANAAAIDRLTTAPSRECQPSPLLKPLQIDYHAKVLAPVAWRGVLQTFGGGGIPSRWCDTADTLRNFRIQTEAAAPGSASLPQETEDDGEGNKAPPHLACATGGPRTSSDSNDTRASRVVVTSHVAVVDVHRKVLHYHFSEVLPSSSPSSSMGTLHATFAHRCMLRVSAAEGSRLLQRIRDHPDYVAICAARHVVAGLRWALRIAEMERFILFGDQILGTHANAVGAETEDLVFNDETLPVILESPALRRHQAAATTVCIAAARQLQHDLQRRLGTSSSLLRPSATTALPAESSDTVASNDGVAAAGTNNQLAAERLSAILLEVEQRRQGRRRLLTGKEETSPLKWFLECQTLTIPDADVTLANALRDAFCAVGSCSKADPMQGPPVHDVPGAVCDVEWSAATMIRSFAASCLADDMTNNASSTATTGSRSKKGASPPPSPMTSSCDGLSGGGKTTCAPAAAVTPLPDATAPTATLRQRLLRFRLYAAFIEQRPVILLCRSAQIRMLGRSGNMGELDGVLLDVSQPSMSMSKWWRAADLEGGGSFSLATRSYEPRVITILEVKKSPPDLLKAQGQRCRTWTLIADALRQQTAKFLRRCKSPSQWVPAATCCCIFFVLSLSLRGSCGRRRGRQRGPHDDRRCLVVSAVVALLRPGQQHFFSGHARRVEARMASRSGVHSLSSRPRAAVDVCHASSGRRDDDPADARRVAGRPSYDSAAPAFPGERPPSSRSRPSRLFARPREEDGKCTAAGGDDRNRRASDGVESGPPSGKSRVPNAPRRNDGRVAALDRRHTRVIAVRLFRTRVARSTPEAVARRGGIRRVSREIEQGTRTSRRGGGVPPARHRGRSRTAGHVDGAADHPQVVELRFARRWFVRFGEAFLRWCFDF